MTSQPLEPQAAQEPPESQTPESEEAPPPRSSTPALRETVLAQWQQARPKMVAQMIAAGTLEARLQETCDLTATAIARSLQQGMKYPTAWDLAQETWMLPSEDRVPSLANPVEMEEESLTLPPVETDEEDLEE